MKALFVAVSALALLSAAPTVAQTAAGAQKEAGSPMAAGTRSLSSQDRMFLKKAGEGNLTEMQLGRLAERKAATPAVKLFGRWMVADHGFANRRLMGLSRFLGHPMKPTLPEKDMTRVKRFEGLSGKEFDQAYLKAMVRDHKTDLRLFRKEAQDGQARMTRIYARNFLPLIRQHLQAAKTLASESGIAIGAAGGAAATSGGSLPHQQR